MGMRVGVWFFVHPIIPPFSLTFDIFSFALCTKLDLPHPLTLKVTHYIVISPEILQGPTFFIAPMAGSKLHPTIWFEMFSPCKKRMISCFMWTNPYSSTTFLWVSLSMGSHHCYQLMAFTKVEVMSMVWLTKGTHDPPLAILCAFYKQRMVIAS
jgi:hypothetical protein